MVRKCTFFIFFIHVFSYGATYDFEINNLLYKVDLSAMEATIVGTNGRLINADIPSVITYNNRSFTVTKIGNKCFREKTLYSLTIPNTITEIGESAFEYCDLSRIKNKKIIIPSSIEIIQAWNYFNGCDTLIIEDSYSTLKWTTTKNCFKDLMNCFYLYIGRDITTLNGATFYGLIDCDRIKDLIFGDYLSSCHVSMSYYSPNDVKYNEKGQFPNLETIILGKSMRPLNGMQNCPNLKRIISRNDSPFPFERYEYSGIEEPITTSQYMNVTLYIPKGCIDYYMDTDGWKYFFNIVEAEVYPVKVIAKSYTKMYGTVNPFYDYYTEGAVLDGHPAIYCDASEKSPVGKYIIKIEKGSIKNPCVDFVNGILNVTKVPLTIKAKTYTKKQGEDNPSFNLEYEGFMNEETNDVLTRQPDVVCYATKNSPIGEYPVIVRDAEAKNYDISYINGVLIVEESKSNSVNDTNKNLFPESIYNLNGQPQIIHNNSLNIIRMSNGTTQKVMVK